MLCVLFYLNKPSQKITSGHFQGLQLFSSFLLLCSTSLNKVFKRSPWASGYLNALEKNDSQDS